MSLTRASSGINLNHGDRAHTECHGEDHDGHDAASHLSFRSRRLSTTPSAGTTTPPASAVCCSPMSRPTDTTRRSPRACPPRSFTVNTADVGNIQFFLIPDGADDSRNSASRARRPDQGHPAVRRHLGGRAGRPERQRRARATASRTIFHGAGANALFTETSKNAGGVDYASSTVGTSADRGDARGRHRGRRDRRDRLGGSWPRPGIRTALTRSPATPTTTTPSSTSRSSSRPPVADTDATVSEDAGATTINVLANDTDRRRRGAARRLA